MRIAIDAMGGDFGPVTVVPGAIDGARLYQTSLLLTGRRDAIETELSKLDTNGLDIAIVDTPEAVGMDESPAMAVRKKPRSSINLAIQAVKTGDAGAMVSAGNSGAVMASAFMALGRIPGVDRPALTTLLPSPRIPALLLDLGAVVDPTPMNLVEFALMAKIYREKTSGSSNPSVGLLSIGEEPSKGNTLAVEANKLLSAETRLNFHGNVEGKDVLAGVVDIIVTDGFTGNVTLKTVEGVIAMFTELIELRLANAEFGSVADAKTARAALAEASSIMDYAEIGGAPLLGVNGSVVICHGRSSRHAMCSAVGMAQSLARLDVVAAIEATMSARATPSPEALPAGSERTS